MAGNSEEQLRFINYNGRSIRLLEFKRRIKAKGKQKSYRLFGQTFTRFYNWGFTYSVFPRYIFSNIIVRSTERIPNEPLIDPPNNVKSGCLVISTEPSNYAIFLSILSSSYTSSLIDLGLNNLKQAEALKSTFSAKYGGNYEFVFNDLRALTIPLGSLEKFEKYRDALISEENGEFFALTFILAKFLDIVNDFPRSFVKAIIEQEKDVRLYVPFRRSGRIFIKHSRTCISPIVTVISCATTARKAYWAVKTDAEVVSGILNAFYPVEIEIANRRNIISLAKRMLMRKTLWNFQNLSNDQAMLFLRIPPLFPPSYSYVLSESLRAEKIDTRELGCSGLLLGKCARSNLPVYIPIKTLPLNIAIFGVPGSGKTTLAKRLAKEYINNWGGKIMVFDKHSEYGDLPGLNIKVGIDDFKLNLLEPTGDPASHTKKLSEIFSMAWPDEFGPVMSYLFRESYLLYLSHLRKNKPSLREYIKFVYKHSECLSSNKARDKAFSIASRLSELIHGAIGNVFDTTENTHEIRQLLGENVVFDLSNLDSDRDANIFTWIILKLIFDYRRKHRNYGIPHVIICEEAHNIVPTRLEGQPTIVEYMLKELRKFGESLWIIDQRPLEVSRDILSLCATIICLRLQYASDVGKIADTMHLTENQRLYLQKLREGEAIVLLARTTQTMPIMLF